MGPPKRGAFEKYKHSENCPHVNVDIDLTRYQIQMQKPAWNEAF